MLQELRSMVWGGPRTIKHVVHEKKKKKGVLTSLNNVINIINEVVICKLKEL